MGDARAVGPGRLWGFGIMHGRVILGSWRRATAAVLAVGALVAGSLSAPTQASAAAPKNGHFALGHGQYPDIAVAPDGTAHVAWVHQSSPGHADQIQYCRVPRGKRACVGLQTFVLPGEEIGQRPYVFLPGGSTVLLLSNRCCFSPDQAPAGRLTELLRSTDGGKTFASPQLIGTHSAQGDAQLGPNGTVYTIDDIVTAGVSVQRNALDGSAPELMERQAWLGGDEYGGSLAVLPSGAVLASHYDWVGAGPKTMHVSEFSGAGDPDVGSSWPTVFTAQATSSPKSGGQLTELASGKKGVFLFSEDNELYPRFQVRKWNGSTFGAPTFITPAAQTNNSPTFWEDASGRTAVAYVTAQGVFTYRASDRKGFATPLVLKASNGYDLRGATAGDGGGFVSYDQNSGTGLVSLVPIPVPRSISESVKGSVLSGKVVSSRTHQPVALQKSTSHGWVTVKAVGLSAKGGYVFTLPKGKAKWRAVALAVEGYAEADGKPISRS
jgi:hypothetical protein